jgi:hypothetical protein
MNNIQKRFILFIFGCIFIRTLLVLFVKNIKTKYLPIIGYIILILAIGFFIIYFFDLRKTGIEVFRDKIWWNDLRPIHGLIYLTFAYLAIHKNKDAWILLLFDVFLGLVFFLNNHYTKGNFKYLF